MPSRFALAAILAASLFASGCSSTPKTEPPKNMKKVPIGKYKIGRTNTVVENKREFWIDEFEVTCDDYAAFLASPRGKDIAPPAYWKGRTPPADCGNRPVRQVSYDHAFAFATSLGKRLPSQEEWEMAARGPEGPFFPWTDNTENIEERAQIKGHYDSKDPTAPVGKKTGKSWIGCADMYGNVYEWTTSVKDGRQIVKGGSYATMSEQEVTLAEEGTGPAGNGPDDDVGFRCVWQP